jgi:hypothetical protein
LRKDKVFLDGLTSHDDYKLDYLEVEAQSNFESTEKWLYLGADALDGCFAKIGLTMGDLSSRSYGSVRPTYYLFCAFKCRHDLSRIELVEIEEKILVRFESLYSNADGSSKRLRHYESGRLSECFYPVDFLDFFINLHSEIYENYRDSFVICGMDDGGGGVCGEFVDCIFNSKVTDMMRYINMIVQY